jgi:alpha-L-fucosidase
MNLQKQLSRIEKGIRTGPFQPSWGSLEDYLIPKWYRDAKLGIFIHWGVYSVPAHANEWYSRNMYCTDMAEFEYHKKTWGPQAGFGYKDFIPRFTFERFDPARWAELFRAAGAGYVVPVAEHHDGFALYDSGLSEWTAVKMGPKRDLLGDLAAAVRKAGMVFGTSSHRAEHWWFMNGGRGCDSDVQDPRFQDFYGPARSKEEPPDEAYMQDWLCRCCEIVDRYMPRVFYFDWWIEEAAWAPALKKFAAYYYNRAAEWKQEVVINYKNRAFADGTAVLTVERGALSDAWPVTWQTDTAVSKNSWGWIEGHDYKSPREIIEDLVDAVSKNGSLLLNVGPKPDGTIAEAEQKILGELGEWMSVNGDAIYGSRPWKIFGEGPTRVTGGAFTDSKRPSFTAEDYRFTMKGDSLYAISLARPDDGRWVVKTLAQGSKNAPLEIRNLTLLGGGAVTWKREKDGLVITASQDAPKRTITVFRID